MMLLFAERTATLLFAERTATLLFAERTATLCMRRVGCPDSPW
jgi:hypothetical protein